MDEAALEPKGQGLKKTHLIHSYSQVLQAAGPLKTSMFSNIN